MEFRWIKEEEIKESIALLKESFPVKTTEERIKNSLNKKNRMLVAVLDQEIVGIVLIRTNENFIEDLMSFHLDNLCVKSTYRNKNIATMLLQEVEKIAKCEKIDYIDLTASNYRKIAHHVYTKNGYDKRESCLFRREISEK